MDAPFKVELPKCAGITVEKTGRHIALALNLQNQFERGLYDVNPYVTYNFGDGTSTDEGTAYGQPHTYPANSGPATYSVEASFTVDVAPGVKIVDLYNGQRFDCPPTAVTIK